MSKELRLFGYIRVSTKGQIKAPGGIKSQKEMIEKWAKLHKHDLVKVYSDAGVSAIDRRRAFEKMMAALENKETDGVVVTKLDRFGRSVQDLVSHIMAIQNRGQHFISIGDSIDTSTAGGRLYFHILAAFAEFEREIIRERMAAGRKRAEEKGKITHRPRNKLIDPEQLKKLRELYERKVSISALAKIFKVSRPTVLRRLREMGV